MVIPISQASREYANEVRRKIRAQHFFVDVDHGDNKMEKKIRDAQLEQYNYILVRLSRLQCHYPSLSDFCSSEAVS